MGEIKSDYKEDLDKVTVVFETNMGSFEAELYAKECPETVWNFINLAEGRQKTQKGGNFYETVYFTSKNLLHYPYSGFVVKHVAVFPE